MTTTVEALKGAQRNINAIADNMARAVDPNASKVSYNTTPDYAGGTLIGLLSKLSRHEDPILAQTIRTQASETARSAIIYDTLGSLDLAIGNPSKLVAAIDDFVSSALPLAETSDTSLLQAFVMKATNLADTLSRLGAQVSEMRLQADRDISNSLTDANRIIKNLFDLNKKFSSSGNGVANLHDQRDVLLRELATHTNINISYGPQGQAYVSDANGSFNLVTQSSYSQLSYVGVSSVDDLLNSVTINPIKIAYINSYGSRSAEFEAINNGQNSLSGGKIEGNMQLRDDILVQSQGALLSLVKTVANKINNIHNKFSPYPPKTVFTSEKQVSNSDYTNWGGALTIYPMTDVGKGMDGATGVMRPITIDLKNLPSSSGVNGEPTTGDIINELNSMLSVSPGTPALTLGAIGLSNPGESLINNVMIAGRSNIDNTGTFTFDLDLDGNNYFGSKVEVLAVGVNGVAGGQLPDTFTLQKGQHVRTNQAITINGLNMAAANNVDITIRVIGDNGDVKEGIATFVIDPRPNANSTNLLNKRIAGGVGPAAPVGALNNTMQLGGITHATIATAKLVDQYGGAITDLATKGNIVIESSTGSALVIDSSNTTDNGGGSTATAATGVDFSSYFGFNNFFTVDELHGSMQVRSDIQSDIRNLSIAAPAAERVAVPVDVNVGSAASTMQLDFNTGGGGAGAALNVADTVTINGVQFTFTGAGGRSVAPGGSLQASLQSLVDAINADGTLSPIMTAALDPLNPRINLTAKQAGLGGNAFNVSAALQVGETVDANGAGAPNQNLGATNFINGASATQTAISIAHMNIGPDSKQGLEFIAALKDTTFVIDGYSTLIPAGANTLSSYAGVVTGVLRNQISQAKQSKEVSTLSLSNFTQQYKQVNGISKEEEQQKAIDGANYYRANLWMSSVLKQMRDELFSYLGR